MVSSTKFRRKCLFFGASVLADLRDKLCTNIIFAICYMQQTSLFSVSPCHKAYSEALTLISALVVGREAQK